VGKDVKPPKISHTPVSDKIYSKNDFEIIITVTDNIGVNPSKVKLFYKIDNDTDYVEKQMVVVSENSNQYRSYVPSQMIGTVISYYFEATDIVSVPNTARLPETGAYNFRILGLIMNIARDEYHTNDKEKYNDFFELLTAPGYNTTPITQQFDKYILKDINLLVITEPSKAFANSEIIAIKNFLNNGGRLFIIGGTNKAVMTGLTEFIDVTWTENNEGSGYSGTFGDVPPIFESVQELYYTPPRLKIESDSPVVELVSNDLNEAVLAVCSYMAQGKIFIITSGFFATDTVGVASNTLFLNNVALWLIKHPIAVIEGSQTKLNGELVNNIHNGTLTIYEDDYVGFDGNDSVNPDWQSSMLNFTWDFGDGNISYGSQPAHKYYKKGEYHVTLVVKTFDGITDSGELLVKVQNDIPIAYPGYTTIKDLTVYFDASASGDTPSDKSSLTYHWDFGDGTTDTGISPVHTYRSKGNYQVTLTVTDNDGARSYSILNLDLDDDSGSSLGNYAPAIAGIVLVIIVLILTFLYQKKKPAKTTSAPEDRVENNNKKTMRNRRVINKPQSRI
jgi:chitodextrinase